MSEIDDLRKQLAQSERIRRVHAAHIRHQQAELDGVKAMLKQAARHGAFLAQQLNAIQGVLDSIGFYPSDHRAFEEIREIIGGQALKPRVDEYKELLASIWLYVKWHYVTKQLTTEQKNLWADAIDEISERNHPGDGMKVERWWQDSEVGGAGVPFEPATPPIEPLVAHYTWVGEKTGEGAGFEWGCSCDDGGDSASLADARVAMRTHRASSQEER